MHIEGGVAMAAITGAPVTVTVTVEVAEQPKASVPVNVYVVVTKGVTVGLPTNPPGFQLYVAAPPPDKTDEPPGQIIAGEAVAVTAGAGFTVTVTGTRLETQGGVAAHEITT